VLTLHLRINLRLLPSQSQNGRIRNTFLLCYKSQRLVVQNHPVVNRIWLLANWNKDNIPRKDTYTLTTQESLPILRIFCLFAKELKIQGHCSTKILNIEYKHTITCSSYRHLKILIKRNNSNYTKNSKTHQHLLDGTITACNIT
jgi:hypothetical protein